MVYGRVTENITETLPARGGRKNTYFIFIIPVSVMLNSPLAKNDEKSKKNKFFVTLSWENLHLASCGLGIVDRE